MKTILVFLAICLAYVGAADAQIIPATQSYTAWENASFGPSGSCASQDAQTALKCHIARQNSTALSNIGACTITVNTATSYSGTCIFTPTGTGLSGGVVRTLTYICPTGYTSSGSGGSTVCNPSAATQGKALADALNRLGEPLHATGTVGLNVCYSGYVVTGSGAVQGRGTLNFEVYGPFSSTGATCTSQPAGGLIAPATPASAAASSLAATCTGAYGYVNGVERCIPPVATTGAGTVVAGPVTTTTDSSGTTVKSGSVTCEGGQCTTVTTTTVTPAGGGSPVVSTATVAEPQADFCTKNPKAAVCVGLADDPCVDNPKRVGCLNADVVSGDPITRETYSFSVTPFSLATSSGCPAPLSQSFTLAGSARSMEFSYQPTCDFLATIAPILLLLAAFGATLIVADSFRVQT